MSNPNQVFCVLDYETFCKLPINKLGAFEYSLHQSTEILCVAFRIGTRKTLKTAKTYLWFPEGEACDHLHLLLKALLDPKVILVAHNALFEILITRNVLTKLFRSKPELKDIPLSRWVCTASLSRTKGLPGKLEEVSKALNLPHQKDMEGHKLMLRMTKPKKPSKKDPSTRIKDPGSMNRLGEYCQSDIAPEVDLLLCLPELSPKEREFWLLDQEINLRGFAVDRALTNGALSLIEEETKRLDKRVRKITGGEISSARQRAKVLEYLKERGIKLPNLQGATVKEYLARNSF